MSGLSATEMRNSRVDEKAAPDSADDLRQRRGTKYQQDIQHFGQIGRTSLAKHSGQFPLARQ
jgi:hypothetical protein